MSEIAAEVDVAAVALLSADAGAALGATSAHACGTLKRLRPRSDALQVLRLGHDNNSLAC
jgi:hypothetical protein